MFFKECLHGLEFDRCDSSDRNGVYNHRNEYLVVQEVDIRSYKVAFIYFCCPPFDLVVSE